MMGYLLFCIVFAWIILKCLYYLWRRYKIVQIYSDVQTTPESCQIRKINLKFGNKNLTSIIYKERNVPTLDLHGMTVLESQWAVHGFVQFHHSLGTPFTKVVTGRGLHSDDGLSRLKPSTYEILKNKSLNFEDADKGGSYLIHLASVTNFWKFVRSVKLFCCLVRLFFRTL